MVNTLDYKLEKGMGKSYLPSRTVLRESVTGRDNVDVIGKLNPVGEGRYPNSFVE